VCFECCCAAAAGARQSTLTDLSAGGALASGAAPTPHTTAPSAGMLRQPGLWLRLCVVCAVAGGQGASCQPIFDSTAGLNPAFLSTLAKLDACLTAGDATCGEEATQCAKAERQSTEADVAGGFAPGAATGGDAVASAEALSSCRLTLRSQASAANDRCATRPPALLPKLWARPSFRPSCAPGEKTGGAMGAS
jgi:hypothetical protein